MSVNIAKTGTVYAGSDSIDKNLLIDTLKDVGKTHTSYSVVDFNFSESLVSGNKYTIIAKVNTSEEKKSIGFYHSGGSYAMYAWIPITTDGIYKRTFTTTSNMASQTSGAGHGFCRVYVSNNTGNQGSTAVTGSANVEWIKIYSGEADSMWTPNEADSYFVTNYHGFIEDDDIANIFEGHVEANQFYEI